MPSKAYFYRPFATPEQLSGYAHVIYQSYDEKYRDALTNVGTIMRYALPQIEGPPELTRGGPLTASTQQQTAWKAKTTWRNGATFNYYEFVTKYHPFETYFLHDATGKRLVSVSSARSFYLIRPRFAAQQFWADVKMIMDRDGWTGPAFIDNVGLDDTKIREILGSTPAQEYAGGDQATLYQAEWAEFLDVGRQVLGKDRKIFVNGIGDWKAERDITAISSRVDGMMLEGVAIGWLNMRAGWTVDDTMRSLKRVQALTEAGKEVVCVLQCSSKDSPEYLAYAYALYLMVAGPNTSVRLVLDVKYGVPPVEIPEMAIDVGEPLGPAKMSTDLRAASRAFEHYDVIIDIANKKASFLKIESQPEPDPRDAQIATLQEQVRGVMEREQQQMMMIAELQQTVAELQQRLSNAKVEATIKI